MHDSQQSLCSRIASNCCYRYREASQDWQEKQKQPYLLNKAFLAKFVSQNPRKHHKEAYDTLFST